MVHFSNATRGTFQVLATLTLVKVQFTVLLLVIIDIFGISIGISIGINISIGTSTNIRKHIKI